MKYSIGFEIVGHITVEAANPQAASAQAIRQVRDAASALEASGENEYRCPHGGVISHGPAVAKATP